jgi:hypothetical protein
MIRGLLTVFFLVVFVGCGPLREHRDVSVPNELAVGDFVTIVTTDNKKMSFRILEKTESSFKGEFKDEDIEVSFDQIESVTVEKKTLEAQIMGPALIVGGVFGIAVGAALLGLIFLL